MDSSPRMDETGSMMSGGGLLKNILMEDSENTAAALVDMYRDLIQLAENLKVGIQHAVEHAACVKSSPVAEDEEEQEEEDEEEEEEEEREGEESEDDEERRKRKKKPKKSEPLTEIEELLEALSLDKRQQQHLLIKKAILLNFEEALFGNNNITMTLDLRHVGKGEQEGRLEKILQCKDLTKYIPKVETENGVSMEFAEKAKLQECINVATQPIDVLQVLRPKTPKKIAVNLIKQRYNIRWNTKSGEARPFDFFHLEKHFMKGAVRRAYVQTLLFEHKSQLADLQMRLRSAEETPDLSDFTPKFIYGKKDPYASDNTDESGDAVPAIRPRDGPKFVWQKWTMLQESQKDIGPEFPAELKWIEPKVKTLLRKLCEPLDNDFNPYETPNTMYIIVLKETTSERLPEIGNLSQIYIGAADSGIAKRFLDGDDSHCARLRQIFEEITKMEEFSATPTGLLIELRLLLAICRQEPYALFAVKAFDDPRTLGREVHDLITKALYLDKDEIWGPSMNMKFGLNMKEEMRKRRKYLPDHFPGSKRKHR